MSGISQPNNYYRARKALEKKGFIRTDEKGNLYISTQKILAQAKDQDKTKEEEA
jgi:DNA-binding transcriptional regulator YhcF (GntR family)